MPIALRRGQPELLQTFTLDAPIGGDDTVSPGLAVPRARSIFSYNLIPAELGLRSRLGWREWAITGSGEQVRTILSYTGSAKNGSANRLFAATTSGIWDVSSSGDQSGHGIAPTRVVTFPVQNDDSGWGCFLVLSNAAGHFGLYFDEANGYYTYTESGATWTKVTAGGGAQQVQETPGQGFPVLDPANLVFATVWKNRVVAVERDTGRGWYLGIGALYGSAAPLYFGNRFVKGGDLRCVANWSGDGGVGLDDRLVAVSGGGDVLVYEGSDPGLPGAFSLKGVWYAGQPPAGRRLTTDNGGELLYMSSLGVVSLATLTAGNSALDRRQYQTFQVANLFNQMQAATGSLRGWTMRIHPQDAALMVLAPTALGAASQQLVMSLSTKGWHRYRDMPIGVCAEPWGGTLYCGTEDGRVIANDGYLDGVLLADPNAWRPIDWSLLSAYSNLGTTRRKRLSYIDVTVLSQGGAIPINAEARFDLDMTEAAAPALLAPTPGSSVWDTGKWDEAKWAGAYQSQTSRFGAYGEGKAVALAIRGSATSRMTLVSAEVGFELGGSR